MPRDRFVVDCRDYPNSNCTLRITGTREEVVAAATHHAVTQHGAPNTDETRNQIAAKLKAEVGEPA